MRRLLNRPNASAFLAGLVLILAFLGAGPLAAQPFLDPAQAFQVEAEAETADRLRLQLKIAPGYYVYRDKLRFASEDATLGAPQLPPAEEKQDENFGKVAIYRGTPTLVLPLGARAPDATTLHLKLTLQGCAEAGICYPPEVRQLAITLPATGTSVPDLAKTAAPPGAGDSSGQIARRLAQAGFWSNLALFFLAGLGLACTPCMFPMLPILSSIIAGQRDNAHGAPSRGRAAALTLVYVLGMALTYTAVGVLAGLTGTLFSSALQNPWVLGGFALVFVLLALSMFDFYELQLPSALQSRLSERSGHLHGGRGPAVFLMGALSALIVGPCVAAPLAGALLYIGQSRDALLGGAALFAMALGMGVPLMAVGLSAGALLPRAGAWMEGVRRAFGVLLLATALWLVAPVLPSVVVMLLAAALLIIPAIYLHALDPLPPPARGWAKFWKGVGIVMLLTGAALLLGALGGSRDLLQPLAGSRGAQAAGETPGLPFVRVASLAELDARLKQPGKPVLLDFYADWCVSCKEMERFTFTDPAVRARLGDFLLLQADVTGNRPEDQALLQRFQLFGPPGIVFFDPEGRELPEPRLVGFADAPSFLALLERVPRR